jgi:D-glycero-alpha-D-manno-heptose 1-phosphate guanylyltransferase
LRRALTHARGTQAYALNGDTLFLVELTLMAEAARRFPGDLVVALRKVDAADRYGTCMVEDGRIVGFTATSVTGPALINGGVYVIPKGVFDRFELGEKFSFEADFMERFVTELAPRAVVSDAAFIDIGVPASYEAAQRLVPSWLR